MGLNPRSLSTVPLPIDENRGVIDEGRGRSRTRVTRTRSPTPRTGCSRQSRDRTHSWGVEGVWVRVTSPLPVPRLCRRGYSRSRSYGQRKGRLESLHRSRTTGGDGYRGRRPQRFSLKEKKGLVSTTTDPLVTPTPSEQKGRTGEGNRDWNPFGECKRQGSERVGRLTSVVGEGKVSLHPFYQSPTTPWTILTTKRYSDRRGCTQSTHVSTPSKVRVSG